MSCSRFKSRLFTCDYKLISVNFICFCYLSITKCPSSRSRMLFLHSSNEVCRYFCSKYLLDRRHPDPSSLLHEGQTLTAKISEVDAAKNRFLVSLRPTDCFHGDPEVGLLLLSNYLTEYYDAVERLKSVEGS